MLGDSDIAKIENIINKQQKAFSEDFKEWVRETMMTKLAYSEDQSLMKTKVNAIYLVLFAFGSVLFGYVIGG